MTKLQSYNYILMSIIIPVYNVQNYIADCLDSVINQDFPSLEIICIDDCSTDKSLKILREFAIRDSRIKILALNENTGLANVRNKGVELACGKYICYLDSDDMLADGCLKKLQPYMDDDLEMLTYEIADVRLDMQPKEISQYRLKHDYSKLGIATGKIFFTEMMDNNEFYYSACFALYHRTWLQSSGIEFREGILYEDGPYTLACYLKCKKMRHVNVQVYVRRYRANSIMTTKNKYTFLHMRSLLWGYEEAIRLYYQSDGLNQREKECLLRLILNNWEVARRRALQLPAAEALHFYDLQGISRLLSVGLIEIIGNSRLYLDGLRLRVMESEQVFLYGAGKIGLQTLSYLRSVGLGKKVCGFVETEKVISKVKQGVSLYCIRDITPQEGTLLILSAGIKHQKAMFNVAEQEGFNDIIVIDLLMRELMQQAIDERSDV